MDANYRWINKYYNISWVQIGEYKLHIEHTLNRRYERRGQLWIMILVGRTTNANTYYEISDNTINDHYTSNWIRKCNTVWSLFYIICDMEFEFRIFKLYNNFTHYQQNMKYTVRNITWNTNNGWSEQYIYYCTRVIKYILHELWFFMRAILFYTNHTISYELLSLYFLRAIFGCWNLRAIFVISELEPPRMNRYLIRITSWHDDRLSCFSQMTTTKTTWTLPSKICHASNINIIRRNSMTYISCY
jgi:hypothetical protein